MLHIEGCLPVVVIIWTILLERLPKRCLVHVFVSPRMLWLTESIETVEVLHLYLIVVRERHARPEVWLDDGNRRIREVIDLIPHIISLVKSL